MIYSIDIKSDQFILLLNKPFSWQVLIPVNTGLLRGDMIKYREVDSLNIATGRELLGVIKFVGSGDMVVNDGSSEWAYCERVSEPIGIAKIGSSFIVA